MKLPNFSVKWISYMKFSFSYVNCYFIYDLIFIYENSYMKLPNFTCEMDFIYEI